MNTRVDGYQRITDTIVNALETPDHVFPWHKPWNTGGSICRPLRHTTEPYQGINVLMLWISAYSHQFSSSYWMTYRQAQQYKAQVRKGEASTTVVFFKPLKVKDKQTGEDKVIPMLRTYACFNGDQINELPDKFKPVTYQHRRDIDIELYMTFGYEVEHRDDRAFYSVSADTISIPNPRYFDSYRSYLAVLAHEAIHATGAKHRLDRLPGATFGSPEYAYEELVAELGSAFLCSDLGLTPVLREDHIPYIQSWIKALKNDNKMIVRAAADAERAVAYIHEQQKVIVAC